MLEVYTDGTFYNGMYGGGYCVFENEQLVYQDCGIGINEPELLSMRNISGEMSAAMHATLWLYQNNKQGTIVHDYIGISKWVLGEWQTTKTYTKKYKEFMLWYYQNGIIRFQWVKGHTKVIGNEIADKLAKQAVKFNEYWKI